MIGRLRHPNVVELVAAGLRDDGRPYLCMELLDGEDLAAVIAQRGRMSAPDALAILEPLCAALAAAHELGIVHRDVKASNVVVCRAPAGEPAASCCSTSGSRSCPTRSRSSSPRRTSRSARPSCMAPEQIRGRAIDARTDVYALGALVFLLLTGRMPFEDASLTMTQYLHLHARRPRVSAAAPVSRADRRRDRARDGDRAGRAVQRSAVDARGVARRAARLRAARRRRGRRRGRDPRHRARPRPARSTRPLLADLEARAAGRRARARRGRVRARARSRLERGVREAPLRRARCGRDRGRGVGPARAAPRIAIPGSGSASACIARRATFIGAEVRSGTLLRPASWGMPDDVDGVWVTSAIVAGAPNGTRLR